MPQLVVVVQIFVTERSPEHALPNQGCDRVFDQIGPTPIAKAVYKPIHQIVGSIGRTQKQRSRIRRHQSGIERGFHSAAFDHSNIKRFFATLCRHRSLLESLQKSCGITTFADS